MTTTEIGRRAEQAAADFLAHKGCCIVVRNWRTRWCEIDVIAERNGTIYLCEVKYRSTPWQGSGLDYITPKKIKQMRFAAAMWVATQNWQGDCQLCAIEVSGGQFQVTAAVKLTA